MGEEAKIFRLENKYQSELYQDFVNFLAVNGFKLLLELLESQEDKKAVTSTIYQNWLKSQVTIHNRVIEQFLKDDKNCNPEFHQERLNKDLQNVKDLVRSVLDIK